MKKPRELGFEIQDGTSQTNSHWKNLTGQKQIILVDFDHTITERCLACTTGLRFDGVQEGTKEALTELSKEYQIWIYTGNYDYLNAVIPIQRTMKAIADFLTRNGIPFDRILQTKPPAMFIIDDRAIHHTSWKETMNQIKVRTNKCNEG